MALRLTVQRAAWESHIQSLVQAIDGLVPVVKGNGYGFGRAVLHPVAAGLSEFVCVGTVYELDSVAPPATAVVLTPTLHPPVSTNLVLTVGSTDQVKALSGWHGRVLVKLQSSMRRYGASPAEVDQVVADATAAGLEIIGYALHLPLAGTDLDRLGEIEGWLERLDRRQPLWLSHLQPQSFAALQRRHPEHRFLLRAGTALWHGDKSFLQLRADVIALYEVRSGERAGYHLTEVPLDGHLLVIGAGSAHGVTALAGGASPFHFARSRLSLLEPPHMHTSMALASSGAPCPAVGDLVDVQRPLITTFVDEIEWV